MNSLTFSYVIKGLTVAQSDWIIIRTLLSLERKIVFSLSSDSDYKYQLISSIYIFLTLEDFNINKSGIFQNSKTVLR